MGHKLCHIIMSHIMSHNIHKLQLIQVSIKNKTKTKNDTVPSRKIEWTN